VSLWVSAFPCQVRASPLWKLKTNNFDELHIVRKVKHHLCISRVFEKIYLLSCSRLETQSSAFDHFAIDLKQPVSVKVDRVTPSRHRGTMRSSLLQ
jgi:hypothetical protein